MILPDFTVTSSRIREEKPEVWLFGSLLFCFDRLRESWQERQKNDTGIAFSLRPEMKANSKEEPILCGHQRSKLKLSIRH